ncbi:DUF721 domain-containing protein [Neoactinobaculum massilliense]|uniref:DUF721 domain-containing protein n=1 Tax=Neoactinobaculum massilliense TaxID=2364794 RepID=UPI000F5423F1|nr:DciA family protein [Neoactinobaculum massilliense]
MSKIEQARLEAARKNGDILPLRLLDMQREAAFRRGDIRTRRPSAGEAVRRLEQERADAEPLGDDVVSPGPGWGDVGSGPRPSSRDPHPLRMLLERVVRDRGWGQNLDMASVSARWPEIVGPNVARNCRVESFADHVLTLRTSSTSWKVQIEALLATLEGRLREEVGEDTVQQIVVKGPDQRSWKHGLFSVPSRGPRDTYG